METSTKQDKLLFFGITFITLVALMFIINYVSPFLGSRFDLLFIIPLILSIAITVTKFGINNKLTMSAKSKKLYAITAGIWVVLAIVKWSKYFDGGQEDLFSLMMPTALGFLYLVIYFKIKAQENKEI